MYCSYMMTQYFFTAVSFRLTSGSRSSEGRLEIYHASEWKTVCDNGKNQMLFVDQWGYSLGAQNYAHGAHFGQGSGIILLDDVVCTGREKFYCTVGTVGYINIIVVMAKILE